MIEIRQGYKEQAIRRLERLKQTVTDEVFAAAIELARDLQKATTKVKVTDR